MREYRFPFLDLDSFFFLSRFFFLSFFFLPPLFDSYKKYRQIVVDINPKRRGEVETRVFVFFLLKE